MNNKRRVIVSFISLSLTLIGIVSGLQLVKQKQDIRKKAAAAAVIYFQPTSQNVTVGQTVNFDILVDTGINSLATLRLEINYDSNLLRALSLSFNNTLLPQILRAVDLSLPGKITGSAGVGISPLTIVSGQQQKVASASFQALKEIPNGTQISFGPETSAYSATTEETLGLNLIVNKLPASVIALIPTPTPTIVAAPSVNIDSPSDGTRVNKNKTEIIKASANDKQGIKRVEFFVNAVLICTDSMAPYDCSWNVPKVTKASYVLQAKAYNLSEISALHTIKVTSN